MTPIGIYLAGTIDGIRYDWAINWRIYLTQKLKDLFGEQVIIFDPTTKHADVGYKPEDILDLKNFTKDEQKDIFDNDMEKSRNADIALILVQKNSNAIETIFEIGYMYSRGTILLGIFGIKSLEGEHPLNRHSFITNSVIICDSLNEMFEMAKSKIEILMKNRE